jgi:hypothetical protein
MSNIYSFALKNKLESGDFFRPIFSRRYLLSTVSSFGLNPKGFYRRGSLPDIQKEYILTTDKESKLVTLDFKGEVLRKEIQRIHDLHNQSLLEVHIIYYNEKGKEYKHSIEYFKDFEDKKIIFYSNRDLNDNLVRRVKVECDDSNIINFRDQNIFGVKGNQVVRKQKEQEKYFNLQLWLKNGDLGDNILPFRK